MFISADDTQIYMKITNIIATRRKFESLVPDIKIWMTKKKLKQNDCKTEIIIIRGKRRGGKAENAFSMNVSASQVQPVNSVRNLGAYSNS